MKDKKNIKKLIIPIIVVLLLIIGLIVGVFISKNNSTQSNPNKNTNKLDIESGSDWDGNMPQNGEQSESNAESIEIPGYSELYVSTENPTIQLINPDGYTVYFVYTILEGQDVVYETKAIEPNKMVEVNLKELLEKGEHNLSFVISTYDIETQAGCNGATQEVKLVVNE